MHDLLQARVWVAGGTDGQEKNERAGQLSSLWGRDIHYIDHVCDTTPLTVRDATPVGQHSLLTRTH